MSCVPAPLYICYFIGVWHAGLKSVQLVTGAPNSCNTKQSPSEKYQFGSTNGDVIAFYVFGYLFTKIQIDSKHISISETGR